MSKQNRIMMKKLLITLWLATTAAGTQAQQFKEWFRQNRTQREYLREQIAQLKLYLELTKQGYQIAKDGLDAIHQIKNGEFKLHKNRFDSLAIVKSEITSLSHLRHITDLHGSINQICEQLPSQIATCALMDPAQKKQMLLGLQRLYDDCQVLVGSFLMLIRDTELAMTDDKRIQRLETVKVHFEENFVFAQSFRRQLGLVCKAGQDELDEIEYRRALKGLK